MTDYKISKKNQMTDIKIIAKELNLNDDDIEVYGKYKAKISLKVLKTKDNIKNSNLILVTAINPTPAGEGKSTTSIGLADGLKVLGKKTIVALRQPSMGPVFGSKGGATGGGYAQVVPMEDINLHFTGDIHAITSANNLISAIIDNHIYQGNFLNIDKNKIVFNRVLDSNDRSLRNITIGQGKKVDGIERSDHFTITVASEVMAILCLSNDLEELKTRISQIIIGYSYDDNVVKVSDLGCTDAVAILLKDALKPNLVQTLEKTPALIHGGPFANIAHGCSSIIATKMAMNLADYVVTEAGFGADLGAEKFLNIKCRHANIRPKCVVIVATIRALKMNGGQLLEKITNENLDALKEGIKNLEAHISNIKQFGLNYVIAINKFNSDTENEINLLLKYAKENKHEISLNESWQLGSLGALDLANKVVAQVENDKNNFKFLYEKDLAIEEKITSIATNIYNAKEVVYSPVALEKLKKIKRMSLDNYLICMAKTPYSFSDDPKKLGAVKNHILTVRDLKISNGAGFIVAYAGNVLTMPGLPKVPSALNMSIIDEEIEGLF